MPPTNNIRPRGEDIASALRDWVKDEVKGAATRAYDLGKFFFGVSAGSIAIIITTHKEQGHTGFHTLQLASLALLVVSMFIAVLMVVPRLSKLDGEMDLLSAYASETKRAVRFVWTWFACWLVGFVFGFMEFIVGLSRSHA